MIKASWLVDVGQQNPVEIYFSSSCKMPIFIHLMGSGVPLPSLPSAEALHLPRSQSPTVSPGEGQGSQYKSRIIVACQLVVFETDCEKESSK